MRRGLIVLSVILTLGVCLPLGALAQDEPDAGAASTDARYLLPFGPDGLNAALTATETVGGSCTPESLATTHRPDAWDCIGENNQVYDPCFENPFLPIDEPAQLACFADPFSNEVVLIQLDDPLDRTKEPANEGPYAEWDLPWALELANGDRCVLLHAVDVTLAGEAVHYGCADGGSILGHVDRSAPLWAVNYLADGAIASELVDVTVAWS